MKQEIKFIYSDLTQEVSFLFNSFLKKQFSVKDPTYLHELLDTNKRLVYQEDQRTCIRKTIYNQFDKDIQSDLVLSYL